MHISLSGYTTTWVNWKHHGTQHGLRRLGMAICGVPVDQNCVRNSTKVVIGFGLGARWINSASGNLVVEQGSPETMIV
jgi:hypothetical protein